MRQQLQPYERVFLAWDSHTFSTSQEMLLHNVIPYIGGVKVGLTAIHAGTQGALGNTVDNIERFANQCGANIFYDAKLHDIPNQMAGAVRSIARRRFWGVTIHASAGHDGIRAAMENKASTLVVGVTVLTSFNDPDSQGVYGKIPKEKVIDFAHLLTCNQADGIVCSPHELEALRRHDFHLTTIVPGIRLAGTAPDDQKRTMTPADAIRQGADYLVIGRPIFGSDTPITTARKIADDIATAEANISML